MPRIRTIKPSFWENDDVTCVSRDARLVYIGLWNFLDDLGVISAAPVKIASKIFPNEMIDPSQMQIWLDELVEQRLLQPLRYRGRDYYYVDYFLRNQVIRKPNMDDLNILKSDLIELLKEVHEAENESSPKEQSVAEVTQMEDIEVSDNHSDTLNQDAVRTDVSPMTHQCDTKKERRGKDRKGEERKGKKESLLSFLPLDGEKINLNENEDEYIRFSHWVEINLPNVTKMNWQITQIQYDKLREKYEKDQIIEVFSQMDNYRSLKKYTNAYRTFINFAERSHYLKYNTASANQEI